MADTLGGLAVPLVSQVALSSDALLILAGDSNRRRAYIQNMGVGNIFLVGSSTGTSTTGYLLSTAIGANVFAIEPPITAGAIYGISTAGVTPRASVIRW